MEAARAGRRWLMVNSQDLAINLFGRTMLLVEDVEIGASTIIREGQGFGEGTTVYQWPRETGEGDEQKSRRGEQGVSPPLFFSFPDLGRNPVKVCHETP